MEKVKSTSARKKNTDASGNEQLPSTFKKFRLLPEVEAFYRFVYENDLRKEAKKILERIILQRKSAKATAKTKRKLSAKKAPASN